MNGNLYLQSLKSAKGLKFPETINGDLNLENLRSAEGLKQIHVTIRGDLFGRIFSKKRMIKLKKKDLIQRGTTQDHLEKEGAASNLAIIYNINYEYTKKYRIKKIYNL